MILNVPIFGTYKDNKKLCFVRGPGLLPDPGVNFDFWQRFAFALPLHFCK